MIKTNEIRTFEQYQCQHCGRFFYIEKGDRSGLDLDFGCVYGCDENGEHTRNITIKIIR